VIGAFYQPKSVLIDPDLLKTLPQRQISNGLAEALKMSLTNDADLFSMFENEDPYSAIDTIVQKSVMIKKSVVEQDEKEKELRRVLNFGHTIGHAIESEEELHGLYHGECVALGMVPMCDTDVRERLLAVLQKLNLPYKLHFDIQKAMQSLLHDKKLASESIQAIRVSAPGEYYFTSMRPEEFIPLLQLINRE
jgi:3-dehydroquinate synthase